MRNKIMLIGIAFSLIAGPAMAAKGSPSKEEKIGLGTGATIGAIAGGPVGLSTLAIAVSEEQQTVEDAYEPFLIQTGFLQRTPRGRVGTALAYRHLGLEVPDVIKQGKLL